jgi:hypothetical protein
MVTIRAKPEELEAVAKHVPDAEDACQRARTSLSWELPSLVMEIPGIGSAAIHELKDELIHWLRRYEEKLNEAEELLYRTAAAMRQADQTLAENMKEFGLELLGWYDVQRLFGEYDPITGERISGWNRLLAGGMLLASFIPPVKGAGIAGKAGIKGAKAVETAVDVSKLVSQTKNILRYDKIIPALQAVYRQVVKAPITETIRSFKKQWEELLVLLQPQFAFAGGTASASHVWMREVKEEAKETTTMNIIGKTGDEVVGKDIGNFVKVDKNKIIQTATAHKKGGETVVGHALQKHAGRNPHIWGKVKGGPDQINQMALEHLQEILNGPGGFKRVKNSRGIEFLEKKLPDGRGVRLNLNGTFKGFIDQ